MSATIKNRTSLFYRKYHVFLNWAEKAFEIRTIIKIYIYFFLGGGGGGVRSQIVPCMVDCIFVKEINKVLSLRFLAICTETVTCATIWQNVA